MSSPKGLSSPTDPDLLIRSFLRDASAQFHLIN